MLPGGWAATQPVALAWLVVDGAGLIPVLSLLRTVELPARGISLTPVQAWAIAAGSVALSATWLGVLSLLRRRWQVATPGAGELLAAGISLTYLLLPLVHHLVGTPPAYRYITAASNFFAFDLRLQLLTLAVADACAVGVTWLRQRTT